MGLIAITAPFYTALATLNKQNSGSQLIVYSNSNLDELILTHLRETRLISNPNHNDCN